MGRLVACVPNEDPERLKRVLDAKHRTIGIDTDALAQQANERRERERQEKERDAAFAQLSNYWADQLSIQQQAADKLRREVASELDSFRETNQLKFTRKEWDINRPDHKKIDEPARVGDDDPRLGTSSMQRFEGEDLSAGDRKKAQNEQAKQWWEEQAAHKAALKAAQQEAEQAYAELARYQDMLQLQAKADEAAIRREMSTTTTEINKRMAEEKRLKALQEKAANLAANLAEIDATLNSPFMTEDPNLAASAMSAYRVRKDHYKGMSEAEKQAILATQLAQMEEKKARDAAREAEDAQYARNQNDILRAMDAQAARVDDFKRQQLAKAADVLRKQTEEKTARDKALSELYANKIAPEFFQQFGTSHR
ncbi:coiled-coil protein associated with protofilament ribbons [Haematococcus lacustris]